MVKRVIIAVCMILSMNLAHGMQFLRTYFSPLRFDKKERLTSEFEKFVQKFTPPKELQKIIEKHKEAIVNGSIGIQGFRVGFIKDENSRPLLLPKGDQIDRVINADRVRNCIQQNNFTTIEVPNKYVYPVDNQFKVFVQAIDADARFLNTGEITLEEIKELTSFVEKTCYCDVKDDNILRNKQNGKLAIIDTENRSFGYIRQSDDVVHKVDHPSRVECVHNMDQYLKRSMSEEAADWYNTHLKELSSSPSGQVKVNPLTQYDSIKIDAKKAKKEIKEINIYNRLLARFDKCIADADGNREDITSSYCSTWIKQLKESNERLAKNHNYKRHDFVGKRKEFIEYLKSI